MYTCKTEHYNLISHLLTDLENSAARSSIGATTQKEVARHEGLKRGVAEGIAYGIAAYLNEIRKEFCAKWDVLELVEHWEVVEVLKDFPDVLREAQNVAIQGMEDASAVERRDAVRRSTNSVYEMYELKLREVALSEKIVLAEAERHQKAVLAKEEPATEADLVWLQPMLDKAKADAERVMGLMGGGES